jgi:hypothetical protein
MSCVDTVDPFNHVGTLQKELNAYLGLEATQALKSVGEYTQTVSDSDGGGAITMALRLTSSCCQ